VPEASGEELARLQRLLDYLGHDLDPSILIGGWATRFRIGGEISHDVDLIINDQSLRSKLRETLDDYSEKHRGHSLKARGEVDGVHIDAYIPYESELGERLRLRVAQLADFADSEVISGWLLLTLEAHTVSKMAALLDRPDSPKGRKDAREIYGLLEQDLNPEAAIDVLFTCSAQPEESLPELVAEIFELLPDRVQINRKQRDALRTLGRRWVDAARAELRRRQSATTPRPRLPGT
jgi:hypothetical protein